MAQQYRVLVDWDNNGTFTGAYDVQPALNDGLTVQAGRDTPRTFAPTKPSSATWVADNRDKRFSDFGGVIGANLKPYRAVKVQTSADGTTWSDLFTGVVNDWTVRLDNYPAVTADFEALDQLAFLSQKDVNTPLYNGLRTDQAIGYVLDAVGWSAGARSLDVGLTTLGYWWADQKSALAALQELADHEQGWFYIDRGGTFRFEYRYNRVDRSTTVAATFDDTTNVSRAKWRHGMKDVVNRVTVTVEPRAQDAALSVVWQLGTTLTLGPYESRRLYATGQNPFTGVVSPVAGTDYTLTGGGLASLTVVQASGQTAIMDLAAGANGATLTNLQLRAYAVAITKTVVWTVDDAQSQADYGLQTLSLKLPYLADANVGRDAAQAIVGRYASPAPAVDVTVIADTNVPSQKLTDVTTVKLSDRVQINLPTIGAVWPGFVETVDHKIIYGEHRTVFTVQQALQEGVAMLDDDVYGILDDDKTMLGW